MERKRYFNSQAILDQLYSKKKDYQGRLMQLQVSITEPSNYNFSTLNTEEYYTESIIRDSKFAEAQTFEEILEKVNLAIKRFKNGKFGLCIKCGKIIEPERLAVMPYSEKCSKCA